MDEERVVFLRGLLEALVDSLDATVRIAQSEKGADIPPPLTKSASQLVPRLNAANRSAKGRFTGSQRLLAATGAMTTVIQKLDTAFVVYNRDVIGGAIQRAHAISKLQAELSKAKAVLSN